ncbi:YceD family protein [Clostridium mediterraneense]|uniref:YceD family protein n=1 Tax=Clostridium mediterraneense TaxID=1805472 RepID=UPI000835EF3E|nr:DUF177 domain-containing protein [Clostridium mediterraneense]
MEFKFSELTSKKERSKKLDLIVEQEIIELPGEEIKILEPIKFDGELKMVDDVVSLYGNITTKLELECSRCLKNFSIDVNTDIDEKFSNNYKEDDSIALIEGDILDVADAIVSNVISTLPIKRLCVEQCKGLCQQCGADLNIEKCRCDDSNIDIRFEKLKDLFN